MGRGSMNILDLLKHKPKPTPYKRKQGHRYHMKKGRTPRQVKSPLTGCMIDGTWKGLPCTKRPKDYNHGPSEKAKARK
jgi:hypothetical protein